MIKHLDRFNGKGGGDNIVLDGKVDNSTARLEVGKAEVLDIDIEIFELEANRNANYLVFVIRRNK